MGGGDRTPEEDMWLPFDVGLPFDAGLPFEGDRRVAFDWFRASCCSYVKFSKSWTRKMETPPRASPRTRMRASAGLWAQHVISPSHSTHVIASSSASPDVSTNTLRRLSATSATRVRPSLNFTRGRASASRRMRRKSWPETSSSSVRASSGYHSSTLFPSGSLWIGISTLPRKSWDPMRSWSNSVTTTVASMSMFEEGNSSSHTGFSVRGFTSVLRTGPDMAFVEAPRCCTASSLRRETASGFRSASAASASRGISRIWVSSATQTDAGAGSCRTRHVSPIASPRPRRAICCPRSKSSSFFCFLEPLPPLLPFLAVLLSFSFPSSPRGRRLLPSFLSNFTNTLRRPSTTIRSESRVSPWRRRRLFFSAVSSLQSLSSSACSSGLRSSKSFAPPPDISRTVFSATWGECVMISRKGTACTCTFASKS
mmetsp:Transcript_1092/g.2689  ORF Transcript_1092/g.2689 Transcript_1092/m.2689 type:complete len:426 (+) Transcript_1092:41-1318(+)